MTILQILKMKPPTPKAVGATLGEQHFADVRKSIADGTAEDGTVFVLDFTGIETTNGSYLRASALWLLRCGQLTVRPDEMLAGTADPTSPTPADIYCLLANVQGEVAQEVDDFFNSRSLPILVARTLSAKGVESATIAGTLEPVLRKTLALVSRSGAVTATELHSRSKTEGVSVTAWNNRLADLCALRLIRRRREGKQWIYEPLTKEVFYGRSIHQ